MVKSPPAKPETQRLGLDPWVGKLPWRRKWQPTWVFLPGESPGQRSLVGYSPWSHRESDTTEWLNNHNKRTLKLDDNICLGAFLAETGELPKTLNSWHLDSEFPKSVSMKHGMLCTPLKVIKNIQKIWVDRELRKHKALVVWVPSKTIATPNLHSWFCVVWTVVPWTAPRPTSLFCVTRLIISPSHLVIP